MDFVYTYNTQNRLTVKLYHCRKIAIAHPNIITVSIKARLNKHFKTMLKNAKITLDKCL